MAERMIGRGGPRSLLETIKQKQLIARVHGRVYRFTHHCSAAGKPGGGELGRGDRRISGECCINNEFGRALGHGRILNPDGAPLAPPDGWTSAVPTTSNAACGS